MSDEITLQGAHSGQMMPELKTMLADLSKAPEVYQPSKFWNYYIQVHLNHLSQTGLTSFKRTINLNYFNWTIHRIAEHASVLRQQLSQSELALVSRVLDSKPRTTDAPPDWSGEQWQSYTEFLLLWIAFMSKRDSLGFLKLIDEPLVGDPLAINYENRWVSQDVCNSLLELYSVLRGANTDDLSNCRVAELGAGYGRLIYLLLTLFPGVKVTIIDIPPGLFVSQWYLTNVFPDRKSFRYRSFKTYDEVAEEMQMSSIIFLLPHQVELLPEKQFDLFLNISSLHEMTPNQINLWFGHIDRLTTGHFFTKQWIESVNRHDDLVIKQSDYPVPSTWRQTLQETCLVQTRFFEEAYKIT